MNIVAVSLIILLGPSYGFARGIHFSTSEARKRHIPIPSSHEVWREPFHGKSPFLVSDMDYTEVRDAFRLLPKSAEKSDPEELPETDPRGKIGENDAANSNADSEEEQDDNLKQNNLGKDDNDLNEDKDEEEENLKSDADDDVKDHNEDDENINISEEKDEEAQDREDDNHHMPHERKEEPVNNTVPFFDRGLSLHNSFFNLKQMTNYLKELERALEQVFRQTMEEAARLNGTYANTTEEKVDVNGQKFIIQRSVIKTGDNNSSIFIEAVDVLPEHGTNRTKRSNWYAEKAQKAKESDP